MHVYLYPNPYLPTFSDGQPPSRQQLETAALLLYCESVTLGRLGFHHELLLPSPAEALAESKRTAAGQQPEVVRRYFQEGSFQRLTVQELALFNYVRYCQFDVKFQLEYESLVEAGAVRIASLAEITEQANVDAQARGIGDAWQVMTVVSVLMGFLLSLDPMDAWLRAPQQQQLVDDTFPDTDGMGLTGLYLRLVAADTNPTLLKRIGRMAHGEFLYYSVLLELFTQILLSSFMNLQLISFSEAHLILRKRYMTRVLEVSSALRDGKAPPDDSSPGSGALQFFVEAIGELPVLVPRHADDILRWRQDYAAELQEFRRLCNEVAEDLGGDAPREDRRRELRQRVLRPLERLRRDTEGGLKEFLGHYGASEAVGTLGVLLLGSAVSITFPQLAHSLTGVDLAALAAMGGAAIHAAADISRERRRAIRSSDVAFVLRLQEEATRYRR